jgi:hypothetical protein
MQKGGPAAGVADDEYGLMDFNLAIPRINNVIQEKAQPDQEFYREIDA